MDTLSFERSFDPIEIDFYSEMDGDELDSQDLMDTDESTTVMD